MSDSKKSQENLRTDIAKANQEKPIRGPSQLTEQNHARHLKYAIEALYDSFPNRQESNIDILVDGFNVTVQNSSNNVAGRNVRLKSSDESFTKPITGKIVSLAELEQELTDVNDCPIYVFYIEGSGDLIIYKPGTTPTREFSVKLPEDQAEIIKFPDISVSFEAAAPFDDFKLMLQQLLQQDSHDAVVISQQNLSRFDELHRKFSSVIYESFEVCVGVNKLLGRKENRDYLRCWINFMKSKRVRKVTIVGDNIGRLDLASLPKSLFTITTLVELTLASPDRWEFPEIQLPNLKILAFQVIKYELFGGVSTLVRNCQALECLKIKFMVTLDKRRAVQWILSICNKNMKYVSLRGALYLSRTTELHLLLDTPHLEQLECSLNEEVQLFLNWKTAAVGLLKKFVKPFAASDNLITSEEGTWKVI